MEAKLHWKIWKGLGHILTDFRFFSMVINSGVDSIEHGAPSAPTFTKGWARAHGGTVSRRTANKKLTKLHCPSRKRSPKRLIVHM